MRVTFDFANQCISIDGDSPDLLEILKEVKTLAPMLTTISIETVSKSSVQAANRRQPGEPQVNTNQPDNPGIPKTMREFAKSLNLTSAMDRIAAIGYFKKVYGNQPHFSPKEMDEWFTQCGLQKPKQMSVTLSDTKRLRGYVDSSGRGDWRITPEGENHVVSLIDKNGDNEE